MAKIKDRVSPYFLLLLLGCLSCILPAKAYAYIDPGSGSSLFQLIICTAIGGFFACKLLLIRYKSKLKNLFSKANKKDTNAKN
ncbi:MAG: hypothetical protein KAS13_07160 [Candidatus Omnitrophica bacterium]|nr:hypothetical protein [Candidatus Omnitrophota bacterium]